MNSSILISDILSLTLLVAVALAPAAWRYLQQRRG
jgi:hypothetical protein